MIEGFLTMLHVEADDTELGTSPGALTQIADSYVHELARIAAGIEAEL